ncbi:MAG: DUF2199 domain-containing protein [Anaerolineales bacterium]|nr:DUF2199 domain-containing protein [Anaerolineales bacterium]
MSGYTCKTCGQYHEGLPLSYGSPAPAFVYSLTEKEQRNRVWLSSDQCEVRGEKFFDEKHYFIVGNIHIPIIDSTEIFNWSVWVSLSKENYKRASKLWNKTGREKEPPYFGWLSTSLSAVYPETLNLKTNVHTQPVGIRPFIELEPTDHPLAIEQRNGITMSRVQEIAELVLHPK